MEKWQFKLRMIRCHLIIKVYASERAAQIYIIFFLVGEEITTKSGQGTTPGQVRWAVGGICQIHA
jgi:hypothetical protein